MSKKLAVDSDGILLDVKIGTGAFMKDLGGAKTLARAMIDLGRKNRRATKAVISDMNQPLGVSVGNSLEVVEAIDTLKGRGPQDFSSLCRIIAGQMLVAGGMKSEAEALRTVDRLILSGEALRKFDEFVYAQGGPEGFSENYAVHFKEAEIVEEVRTSVSGYVQSVDAESIGLICMRLGAGRERKEDVIDPSVGVRILKRIGDRVEKDEVIAVIYANDKRNADNEAKRLVDSFVISEQKTSPPPIVYEVI
jgi:pyrimidine-nucleoside phosphorylase